MRYEDLPRDELVRLCQRLEDRLAEAQSMLALAEARKRMLLTMAARAGEA